ncbi:hypothetical protein CH379_011130 [Leptospira ellisii]|uniref:Lipoprotein n=1 Tax=Leptospira ellisii TaxID=2023197 RepID=A0A2N0B909_9LEPT|nr:hypothetical protein [Leptospira ellisii]MDV6236175.1 hypothetical protein [Leptospira ellisii]PJZ93030.1 hypothetical protein CH379_09960 [Leptospira ellisii]PKA03576.1 hypothetical protein CH375_16190 [Leptospira ellisii]
MKKRLILLAIAAIIGNCAFPAEREGMRVTDYKAPNKIGDKIFIEMSTGGKTTLPFWTSQIPDDNFTDAVKDSIAQANLFEKIEETLGGGWTLKIQILEVDQPFVGTTFTVKTKIKYTLRNKGEVVKELEVYEAGEATMGDALIGVVRLRLANENSARANIRKFLQEISAISANVKKKK